MKAFVSLFAAMLATSTARAENILVKGNGEYLGKASAKTNTFTTCSGGRLTIGKQDHLKPTSDHCGNLIPGPVAGPVPVGNGHPPPSKSITGSVRIFDSRKQDVTIIDGNRNQINFHLTTAEVRQLARVLLPGKHITVTWDGKSRSIKQQ